MPDRASLPFHQLNLAERRAVLALVLTMGEGDPAKAASWARRAFADRAEGEAVARTLLDLDPAELAELAELQGAIRERRARRKRLH